MLVDNDMVYATASSSQAEQSMPQLPSSTKRSEWTLVSGDPNAETKPPPVKSFEYVRRGQRCGDIGWGCHTVNPNETGINGRNECAGSARPHARASCAPFARRSRLACAAGRPAFRRISSNATSS